MRIGCVLLALALLTAVAPARAADKLPVQTLTLERKSPDYEIKILYPLTGHQVIDRQVAAWVKAQADWFAQGAKRDERRSVPDSLDGSYGVIRNDREMFEILFQFDTYTGGAHPNHALYALNFVLPEGRRVYLAEIMEYGGITTVSRLAMENLTAEIGSGSTDALSNDDQIRSGTVARPGAFETFTLMKDRLTLIFNEYEVAAYAAGPQKTEIPLAKLRSVMRDRGEWGKAQPSFDCARAATAVEKALCADVELARLDRRLAEAYWWKVQLAEGEAGKTRERDAQRAFLSQRDAACGAQADAAITQCLTAQYQARLKAFEVQPD